MSDFIYAVREYIEYEGLVEEAFFKSDKEAELKIKRHIIRSYYGDKTDFDELVRQSKVPMLNPTPTHEILSSDLGLGKLASGEAAETEVKPHLYIQRIDLH
ncbi:hypothetical protein [Psychrobacter sanguinis]|uniref:hypothetical protein n=1 Tax=Psychrobacter sanguinis TaxID=861445 RepID=UPI001919F44A|nr:hypothetical protein [Psychrobacter sanguinis]MCC3344873.1 hypothetical protein [Psychrobacter sanguinis]